MAYSEFWATCTFLRVLVARPEQWSATFLTGMTGLLQPRERLALPGAQDQVVWLGRGCDTGSRRPSGLDAQAVRPPGHQGLLGSTPGGRGHGRPGHHHLPW